jgi:hypothetical protein|uniref:Putative zinc-finger domain-containing protein n=1 Tax=Desulfobacca acetoxidans TaxID=60893 RepID=A0A7C3Z2A6_9BACT
MTWRCALIQRRLPDYPDGDLSPFWKRRVAAHLEVCPDCRREWEEISEVLRLYQANPLPDPGPAFWQEFQQELHLQLAQANQAPEPARFRLRLPHYLLGATAMAGILALAVYLGPFSRSSTAPGRARPPAEAKAPKVAERRISPPAKMAGSPAPEPSKAASTAEPAEPQFSLAAGHSGGQSKAAAEEQGLLSEDDGLDWDVDSVVADLTREQQQHLKSRLESRR